MADRERGVVVKPLSEKGFGFIRRPNQPADAKPLFFHIKDNPQGKPANAGDEVEYEVANGAKGPEAHGLTIVAKAPSSPASTPTATIAAPAPAGAAHPSHTPAAPPEPLDYNVEFMFSDQRYPDPDNRFELDVAVFITDKDGSPVKGATVNASTQYGSMIQNLNTGLNGEAPFTIMVDRHWDDDKKEYTGPPLKVTNLTVSVVVSHHGKELTLSELWPRQKLKAQKPLERRPAPASATTKTPTAISKPTSSAAPPVPSATAAPAPPSAAPASPSPAAVGTTPPAPATTAPLEPDNLVWNHTGFPNPDGSFEVTFTTRNGDNPLQGTFAIQASSETTVMEPDGSVIVKGRRFSLETDADGNRVLLLNPKDRRTEFVFTNLANNRKYKEEFVKPPAEEK